MKEHDQIYLIDIGDEIVWCDTEETIRYVRADKLEQLTQERDELTEHLLETVSALEELLNQAIINFKIPSELFHKACWISNYNQYLQSLKSGNRHG